MQNFLVKLVTSLTTMRGMSLEKLSRERLRLRNAVKKKIDEHRHSVMQVGYQRMLFSQEIKNVKVSADCVFKFLPSQYSPKELYEGIYLASFKKHVYRAIGTMNDEEARCAEAIDKLPQVKYWVRNIERSPNYSFWLPTSTDKFYPDFVAQLDDGRLLAVEYKGSHLLTSDDTREKQAIGELWANQSNGECIFLLVGAEDFESRLRAVAS